MLSSDTLYFREDPCATSGATPHRRATHGDGECVARIVWRSDLGDSTAARVEAAALVRATSSNAFGRAVGDHGETILIRALSAIGGYRDAGDGRSFRGRGAGDAKRSLDVIWSIDGHHWGFEVKNGMQPPTWGEVRAKMLMCETMGIGFVLVARVLTQGMQDDLRALGAGVVITGEWLFPRSLLELSQSLQARGMAIHCSKEPTEHYRHQLFVALQPGATGPSARTRAA